MEFNYLCKFRYDEDRPNRGQEGAKLAGKNMGKENPKNKTSGGGRALLGRCINTGRKCIFPNMTHTECKLSNIKKHKHTDKIKFKGKGRKKEGYRHE